MTNTYPTPTPEQLAQAAELRASAVRNRQEAYDSFERCDTDGFLSQAAHNATAAQRDLDARILENGGVHRFLALFDLSGNWVPARTCETRYGTRWMILDDRGRATGEFLPYIPVRRTTLAKRGYVEGHVLRPARAEMGANWHPYPKPTDRPWDPPTAILSTDRWADEDA